MTWICGSPECRAVRAGLAEIIVDGAEWVALRGRVEALAAALYGAAESLASFRPRIPDHHSFPPAWTELDEVTLHDAQRLCGKYPEVTS